ncbi:unnamed protein product [Boreogadus saida]
MDDERLVVEVEKYVELYDQSSRHYKDNSKKVIAWRAIALEIGSSAISDFSEGDMLSIRRWWCGQLLETFMLESPAELAGSFSPSPHFSHTFQSLSSERSTFKTH